MGLQLAGVDFSGSLLCSFAGTTPQLFAYSPFGATLDEGAPFGFNGERSDPLTAVFHLGNGYRAFSPMLMRFTCPDSESPFGAGGINCYAYCGNDPVNSVDPDGHVFGLKLLIGEVAERGARRAEAEIEAERAMSKAAKEADAASAASEASSTVADDEAGSDLTVYRSDNRSPGTIASKGGFFPWSPTTPHFVENMAKNPFEFIQSHIRSGNRGMISTGRTDETGGIIKKFTYKMTFSNMRQVASTEETLGIKPTARRNALNPKLWLNAPTASQSTVRAAESKLEFTFGHGIPKDNIVAYREGDGEWLPFPKIKR
ncbi:RHS repeat-associated core domain-containing protein [Paraburkholderia rhizosphaerae]|uniref:RHS repeat-associated protein n=1 Tax=Paraburkholderia rhizosphaerae TaxID=480658 RepID=A0A4R8LT15_9BURK|nr:RHS repeat-associated core domain-containing protein [Paraburkholderia rhizosphaerae]TDY50820.1 RHS repeat-associated protein [Paraburkholderia rhizosphaerae]